MKVRVKWTKTGVLKFKDRNPLIHYRIDTGKHLLATVSPVKGNIRIFAFTGHAKS